MVYMPSALTGKAWKLARPYHGPYRVVSVTVEARLIDTPDADTIFVAVNRVRHCYPEQTNISWTGQRKRKPKIAAKVTKQVASQTSLTHTTGPVTRLMTRAMAQKND